MTPNDDERELSPAPRTPAIVRRTASLAILAAIGSAGCSDGVLPPPAYDAGISVADAGSDARDAGSQGRDSGATDGIAEPDAAPALAPDAGIARDGG